MNAPPGAGAELRPLYVTRRNALAVVGEPWPWCIRRAVELGVPVLRHGKKCLLPLVELRAALERQPAAEPATAEDAAARVRATLGRSRKT